MKKILTVVLAILAFNGSYAQVLVDSPEYNQAKQNGTLGNVLVLPNPATGVVPPGFVAKKKPVKEGPEKANSCNCYVQPDATYTSAMGPNDDGSSAMIALGFNFCLYGTTYTHVYINNNGNLTFTNSMSTFSATAFPSSANGGIVAPFWGDVDTRGTGQVVYKLTPSALYVNWEAVGYYSYGTDLTNTFQVIITDGADPVIEGGNVAFCYGDMQWTTGAASSGVNGFGGIPATAGANAGDGTNFFLISRFDHPGNDFSGALDTNGISWLDYKSFAFDACAVGNVPPIPDGVSSCDTFKICALGDTADISINFLSPESNQSTSITYSMGGLTTYQEIANMPGNTAELILRVFGDGSAGFYNVTVTATDNFPGTPGVTTLSFVIQIDNSISSTLNPQLQPTPLIACDTLNLWVANGPYDSYLWDDFTNDTNSIVTQSGTYGVTVSLNGCYKRVAEPVTIVHPAPFNFVGDMIFCAPPNTATIYVSDSLAFSSITWGLSDPSRDTMFINELTTGIYSIHATDSSGYCQSDTVFTVQIVATPQIFADTIACDLSFQVSGTQGAGGTWSALPSGLNFSSTSSSNPLILTSNPGTYQVTYSVAGCPPQTSEIIFPPYPQIFTDTQLCSLSMQVVNTQAYQTGGYWTSPNSEISFSPSNGTLNPVISSNQSGFFSVTFTDSVCHNTTSAQVTMFEPPRIFNDTLACFNVFAPFNNFALSGGTWYAFDTAMHISPVNATNPVFSVSHPGVYTVSFVDNQCHDSLTSTIFYPGNPWTPVSDTSVCFGTAYYLQAAIDTATNQSVWNTGATGTSILVTSPGTYTITSTNECYTYIDSAVVSMFTCDVVAPNIIVRSSTVGNNKFILTYDGISSFHCQIFNRWGNKVYEFSDINAAWDGRDQDGTALEPGVYFYMFEATSLNGTEINKQGFVELFD